MKKPLFFFGNILCTLCCAAFWSVNGAIAEPFSPKMERPPNIVVILCDDLGYGDLACYGNSVIDTPQLDALATQGIRFTDFYATAPVCSASRAGLLTGRTPSRIGVFDWIPNDHVMHLPASEITFATMLHRAGYKNALTGKWHCNGQFNSPTQPQPNDHGFDHWFATQNNAFPSHHNPNNFVRNGVEVGEMEGYSCELVVDEAINWLQSLQTNQKGEATPPFSLFVTFHEPHEPIASDEKLVEKYMQKGVLPREKAEHHANVESVDRAVGRLTSFLKEQNLWDNTLLFFTSDNGPEKLKRYKGAERSYGTAEPLRDMKLSMYDGGHRVPGIAVWPNRITPGQVSNIPVGAIDLFPTFCELVGQKLPNDRVYDGCSLVPLIDGKSFERSQPLFWFYLNATGKPKMAMRDGDWKIVAALENSPKPSATGRMSSEWFANIKTVSPENWELYKIKDDIAEKVDLAEVEPLILSQMKEKMYKILRSVQKDAPILQESP
ncbi:MAG: sulfatase-like hydrolase/transferase [Thermoguttaceae bacterium]